MVAASASMECVVAAVIARSRMLGMLRAVGVNTDVQKCLEIQVTPSGGRLDFQVACQPSGSAYDAPMGARARAANSVLPILERPPRWPGN
eukprot:4659554-Pyramimonas_sp.AAC.1